MHLAQLNIGELLYPAEDPRMEGFTGRIETINALADRSPGFVWRMVDDSDLDGALDLRMPGSADMLLNMSVWESLEALYHFVYKTAHAKLIRDRKEWFVPLNQQIMVLWWIEEGHIPTPQEAAEKLEMLERVGPSPSAFTFDIPFDAEGVPITPELPKKDCA